MTWPTHGSHGGRHDWATYLERGYVTPFREAVRELDDVDTPVDDTGRSMLMYAVSAGVVGSVEIAGILIAAKADVNRRDASGRPVWDFAPTWGLGSVEIWSALLRAGLDVKARGAKNETPLLSVCAGYVSPATNQAFRESRRAIVQLLLDAGAEIDAADQYGDTPLQAAAAAGNIEVVKLLVKAGADRKAAHGGGRSALFEGAMRGHADIVRTLLRAGADVEAATLGSRFRSFPAGSSYIVDAEGVTPLIAAAENGHFEVLRLLVDAGGDVRRADSTGFTPLMGAARAGHAGMAKFLVERGADLRAVDQVGRNALAYAVEFGHQREMASVLAAVGPGKP
jgi:ankyrin repeat protein